MTLVNWLEWSGNVCLIAAVTAIWWRASARAVAVVVGTCFIVLTLTMVFGVLTSAEHLAVLYTWRGGFLVVSIIAFMRTIMSLQDSAIKEYTIRYCMLCASLFVITHYYMTNIPAEISRDAYAIVRGKSIVNEAQTDGQ